MLLSAVSLQYYIMCWSRLDQFRRRNRMSVCRL